MDLSFEGAVLTLNTGKPLRLRDARARRVSIVQGAVWITQDRDRRDTVLEPGAEYLFDRPGLAVIQALGSPALIALEDGIAIGPAAPRTPWGWAARLCRRWYRALQGARSRAYLRAMSDRELADVGIRRSQIELIGN